MQKRRPFPHHGKRAFLFALFSLDPSLFRYPFAVRKDKQKFIDAFLKENDGDFILFGRYAPCTGLKMGNAQLFELLLEYGHGVPKFLFALPQKLRGNINAC